MIAKIIPAEARGSFFGGQAAVANVAIGGAVVTLMMIFLVKDPHKMTQVQA